MNQNQEEVPVEQVDREAAVDYQHGGRSAIGTNELVEFALMRTGDRDHHPLVQAFARHRIASHNEGKREGLELAASIIEADCIVPRDYGLDLRNFNSLGDWINAGRVAAIRAKLAPERQKGEDRP